MTDREQFEAWVKSKCPYIDINQKIAAWGAWQAARAQPAPITSESGNQDTQGASGITSQAGPRLTDEDIKRLSREVAVNKYQARAVERAVRANLGVAVPMTDEQADDILLSCMPLTNPHRLIRAVERHHGIVGKEGGNA